MAQFGVKRFKASDGHRFEVGSPHRLIRCFSSTAETPLETSRTRTLKRKHDEVDDAEGPAKEQQQGAEMEVEENGNNREDDSQRAVVLTRGYFDPVPLRSSPTTEGRVEGTLLEQEDDDEFEQEEEDAEEEVSIWLHGTDDWWRF